MMFCDALFHNITLCDYPWALSNYTNFPRVLIFCAQPNFRRTSYLIFCAHPNFLCTAYLIFCAQPNFLPTLYWTMYNYINLYLNYINIYET